MKIELLIKKLQELQINNPGIDVAIFDHRKNLGDDIGHGSSLGIYSDFEPIINHLEDDEAEYYQDVNDVEYKPWCSLAFDNEDYNDEGDLI
jgi:hypothetical protein